MSDTPQRHIVTAARVDDDGVHVDFKIANAPRNYVEQRALLDDSLRNVPPYEAPRPRIGATGEAGRAIVPGSAADDEVTS